MTSLQTHAEEIREQFSDHLTLDPDDIADRLETLVEDYRVPIDEARRSVVNHYLDEADLERDALGGTSDRVTVADIDEPERWIDILVKVVDLWEPRSDAIAQVGLLGDESGTIKFTKWATSDLPELREGAVYHLGNVVTDEYEGQYSVKLNSTTTIDELDETIEVGENSVTVEGALVDIQSGSGLIKRCSTTDCTRVLQNGRCAEHGEVEGTFDLRIKAVIDDGNEVAEVLFDRAATENLTGITLEDAKEMAMDALDTGIVADEIADQILGRYYRVTGPTFTRYVLADEVTLLDQPVDPESILITARSLP